MTPTSRDRLRQHLITTRLAGEVQTTPREVLANVGKLAAGHPDYTFGLDDWNGITAQEVVDIVVAFCGQPAVDDPDADVGWIDPDRSLEGLAAQRRCLTEAAEAGGRVLLATGHPTGLLAHYAAIGQRLTDAGCDPVTALDDVAVGTPDEPPPAPATIRFVDGVACATNGRDLLHTHRPHLMEAMLDQLADEGRSPDVVVADHGMAGAAIQRGLRCVSIADNNDPALMVAQHRGRTDGLAVIDDNLTPAVYEPVTEFLLADVG